MTCPRCTGSLQKMAEAFDRAHWQSTFEYYCGECKSYLIEQFTEEGSSFSWEDMRNGRNKDAH